MTDKDIEQIDKWLSGQKRYKLFDTERLAVLRDLSGSQFKVWFFQWVMERDEQESWLSIAKLTGATGLSENTVIKSRKQMKELGWMKETGKTAADKYSKPTRGANKVKVLRVDDPSKNAGVTTELSQHLQVQDLQVQNVHPPKSEDKLLVSVSSCDSDADVIQSSSNLLKSADERPVDFKSEEQKQKQKPSRLASTNAWWEDDYEKAPPDNFNDLDQVTRTEWSIANRKKKTKETHPVSATRKPFPVDRLKAPPPAKSDEDDGDFELLLSDNHDITCAHCHEAGIDATFPHIFALEKHAETVHNFKPSRVSA